MGKVRENYMGKVREVIVSLPPRLERTLLLQLEGRKETHKEEVGWEGWGRHIAPAHLA